ncbi:glucose-6-phosphate isomerase [Paraburkholderia sp. SARCC-3016]|uniref:glucose-6-phosphate isomerase n=1 Tax=Paraburkholderia sp. SARCC-3016 TaxID=3058611 RepID=UPI00280887EE|nr:glucose-6-phosphate isomerase [Paraburkholderia sp. SARCC-3016]MDQ7977201.1 glucose-6-phosphate isomerase [Paraburkholderia sp. SARCC-3016]
MASLLHAGATSARGLVSGDRSEWMPPALLWLVTAVLIVGHQGTALTYGFPLLSVLVGAWLYFRSPARYIGFVWWQWFLSPEVRRLADWSKGSYTPTSLIQIAPLAVTMICGLSLLRYYPILAQRRGLPVLLILFGLAYGLLIGIVSAGPLAAVYDLANWLYPILIGFHIMVNTRDYPKFRETIVNTFIWGMLVMGVYGVVQFFIMPAWDVLWMLGSQMSSQGDPVPQGVRVFSTMNSSGPFALAMLGAMVFVLAAQHKVRWIAGAFGFISFALSLVRSTWGGWVIALAMLLVKSNNKVRFRIIASGVLLIGLGVPLLAIGPVADRMQTRLQTLTDLDSDPSYQARNQFYATFAKTAFTDVAGEGMGATGTSTKLASGNDGQQGQYGSFDSGVMNVPFVLGWPGTLLYVMGIAWLVMRAVFATFKLGDDKFVASCLSLSLAILAMIVFTNTLVGTGGALLFMSLFSILSAAHYEKQHRRARVVLHGVTD